MDALSEVEAKRKETATRSYQLALLALQGVPEHCAQDVGELAGRIGADKLQLIKWIRADVDFARLIASKMLKTNP